MPMERIIPYPRGNFTTYPIPGGIDLSLVEQGRFRSSYVRLTTRRGTPYDYVMSPHIHIPQDRVWISDGHRYVVPMYHLQRTPNRVLSIDLDYFSGVRDITLEAGRLLQAVCVASQLSAFVIADFHEDLPIMGEGVSSPQCAQEAVDMINQGEITDANFIPFMSTQTLIIKPSDIRHSQSFREERDLIVTNADQLLSGSEYRNIPDLKDYFDMIHLCTSPTYIHHTIAFNALKTILKIGFDS